MISMSEPTDPRLVNVIAAVVIKYLDETPVPKVNKRVLSFQIADAVWAWLAEGDLSGSEES